MIDQELMSLVCDYDEADIEDICDNDNAFYHSCITEPKVYRECIDEGWRTYVQRYNDHFDCLCVQNPKDKREQLQFLFMKGGDVERFKAFLLTQDRKFELWHSYVFLSSKDLEENLE